jgi:hypothetical protein
MDLRFNGSTAERRYRWPVCLRPAPNGAGCASTWPGATPRWCWTDNDPRAKHPLVILVRARRHHILAAAVQDYRRAHYGLTSTCKGTVQRIFRPR